MKLMVLALLILSACVTPRPYEQTTQYQCDMADIYSAKGEIDIAVQFQRNCNEGRYNEAQSERRRQAWGAAFKALGDRANESARDAESTTTCEKVPFSLTGEVRCTTKSH